MELVKEFDEYTCAHEIKLKDNEKVLKINYAGNGDLYMSITEGRRLDKKYGDSIFIDIKEEDGAIYDATYNLYSRIMFKNKKDPRNIVDEDNNVVWLDDDRPENEADKFLIQNYGKVIRLKFVRICDDKIFNRKNSRSINIRFCMNESRYKEYAYEFDKYYKDLSGMEKGKQYRK